VSLPVGILVVALSGTPRAQNNPEPTQSLPDVRKAAEAGDVKAQSELGARYTFGSGAVNQDYIEAAKWDRLAAEHDDVSAQYRLIEKYLCGQGVQRSDTEALKVGSEGRGSWPATSFFCRRRLFWLLVGSTHLH